MTPTLPARVGGALWLIALGVPAHAQTFNSVQDGTWSDPATWDLGLAPLLMSTVQLSHDVTYSVNDSSGIEIEDLSIGVNADASLTSLDFVGFIVHDTVIVGQNGFSGRLDLRDADLFFPDSMIVGLFGPGSVIAREGILSVITDSASPTPNVEVGLFGSPASITTRAGIFSNGGMTYGADATVVFTGEIGPSTAAFIQTDGVNVDFFPGSVVDLSLTQVDGPPSPGDVLAIASTGSAGVISGTPTFIPPIGYTVSPVFADASRRLGLQVDSVPGSFNWIGTFGDWLEPSNWDTGTVPLDQGGFVTIPNGGGVSLSGDALVPRLALNSLAVGAPGAPGGGPTLASVSGADEVVIAGDLWVGANPFEGRPTAGEDIYSGELGISNADLFLVNGNINVGAPQATGTADLTALGIFSVLDVTTVEIGGTLEVGSAIASNAQANLGEPPAIGTVSTGIASVTLRDIDTVTIEDQLDIADGFAALSTDPGPATANQNATFLAENIGHFVVKDDVDLGQAGPDPGTTETIRGTVTFRNVGLLELGEDLDFTLGGGEPGSDGVLDYEMTLNLENTTVEIERDIDMNGNPNIRGSDLTRSIINVNMQNASLLLREGDIADIGNIDLGGEDPTPELTGATGNEIRTEITMLGSTFTTVELTRIGRVAEGAPEDANFARVRLDDGSLWTSGELEQGTRGEFVFHVDGLSRVSDSGPGRGGATGTYSAWDVPFDGPADETAVALSGAVVVDFDFTPPAGTHVFDVISTSAGILLDGADLSVTDLAAGFEIVSFGIADLGDVTTLRLVIERGCLADFDADGEVNIFDVVAFITEWNAQGPGADFDESGEINIFDVVAFINVWNAGCP